MADLSIIPIEFADIERHSGAVDQMLRGELTGIVVRGVFSPDQMRRVAAQLHQSQLHRYDAEHWTGYTFGQPVITWGEDLDPYFADGAAFPSACRELFADGDDYQQRIERVLSVLANGRPVEVPLGPDSRPYLAATVREVEDGGSILVHCENETTRFPGMRHLSTVIDTKTQLSQYLTISTPEAGGKLIVYPLRFGEGAGCELDRMERETADSIAFLESFGRYAFDVSAGDLLVFDAGRHFHRVSAVEGSLARRTMGGFVALSRDGTRLLYWS